MEMKRKLILSLFVVLLSAPLAYGQDLSKYRNLPLGMSQVELSTQLDPQLLHTKVVHKSPAVVQEVTWWPRDSSGLSPQGEPVWQVLFTFYNGELYRILVTYDQQATKGLTVEDMVDALSAQYGKATRPDAEISFPTNELYRSTENVLARWEDAQYSVNLFRSSFLNTFGVVMFSKRLDTQVRNTLVEFVGPGNDPQGDIERRKKVADNLEEARQKNRKIFRP